jgi:phage terminase large subunit-like protein
VKGPWNEAFLNELELFDATRNCKDDQVDAASDAFVTLARNIQMPTFVIPTITQPSPIPTI